MQSNVIEQGGYVTTCTIGSVWDQNTVAAVLPFIDLHDVFCEGVKFGNHKLSLERLHDDHYAWLYDPAEENLVQVRYTILSYFWNWLKSSLMLSIP